MEKKEIISGWNPVKRLLSPVIAELPPLFWPRTKAKALIAEVKIESKVSSGMLSEEP